MTTSIDRNNLPWYRSPMLWLAIALPALTAVACVLTFRLAAAHNDDAVMDNVKRVAQMQTTDLRADEAAMRARIHADLSIASDHRALVLRMPAGSDDQRLSLRLIHPTLARRDLDLVLHRHGDGHWHADIADGIDTRVGYLLQLQPLNGRWRLLGAMTPGVYDVALRPALGQGDE